MYECMVPNKFVRTAFKLISEIITTLNIPLKYFSGDATVKCDKFFPFSLYYSFKMLRSLKWFAMHLMKALNTGNWNPPLCLTVHRGAIVMMLGQLNRSSK